MTTRITRFFTLAALSLGLALGGTALTSDAASAKGGFGGHGHGHGGWGHGHGWGHGGWGHGRRWRHGYRHIGFYGAPYGCVLRRFITEDGDVIVRRRCY